jgi:hypothetical protein
MVEAPAPFRFSSMGAQSKRTFSWVPLRCTHSSAMELNPLGSVKGLIGAMEGFYWDKGLESSALGRLG